MPTEVSLGPVSGGSSGLRGYLARPSGSGPWPGVVAIHEAFGADDVFRRQVDRLAEAGYLTLGLDLFSDGGTARCVMGTFRALGAGRGKPFNDIEAGRQWLVDQPDCTGKVGVIGFCMGGAFALVTAARGFDASSVNYGPVMFDAEKALAGACPVVASYGGGDRLLPGVAKKVKKALEVNDVTHDFKVYPGIGHGFLNDAANGPRPLRPLLRVANVGPRPAEAADAWGRIEAFFGEHLAS